MTHRWPAFTAAAVQAAPVYLNCDATVDKACALIREAARSGARLVAFPEVFVPGFPHWIYLDRPQANEHYFVELVREAVDVPGPVTAKLGQAAREASAFVVIGVNERSRRSIGELFNTNLIFAPEGSLLGWHRKLMPTYAEKMIWSFGDGSTLRVYDTAVGRLGTLCCGENTNPLARFALIAQGEQVHVANYPARPAGDAFDLRRAIEIRSAAHAFEGKCFVVVAGSLISPGMREILGDTPEKRRLLGAGSATFTGIVGPDGTVIAGPAPDDAEEIVYGEIDLEAVIRPKIHHDVAGNYNRFDVLSLTLNRASLAAIREVTATPTGLEVTGAEAWRLLNELRRRVDSASPEELHALVESLLASLPSKNA
ncbi:MAG: carbon-nitrogen hydrolase family protein [Candidatus Rokubacteria bacterium]|nr:carbon-nitrogen hydrolase family protein [Candidatus Rokubacteria bacterium]